MGDNNSVPEILQQQTTTIEFARLYGKVVIARAQEVGVSNAEVGRMKDRMLKWTEIVATYEADLVKVAKDPTMKPDQRTSLMNEMRDTLDSIRVEMFGE